MIGLTVDKLILNKDPCLQFDVLLHWHLANSGSPLNRTGNAHELDKLAGSQRFPCKISWKGNRGRLLKTFHHVIS